MATPIHIPHFLGGISRQPDTHREPSMSEEADNVIIDTLRGLAKRPGSEVIAALDIDEPGEDKFYHWMIRDEGEAFLLIINPDLEDSDDNVIQIVNLEDGSLMPVVYSADDPRTYLTSGTGTPDQQFRAVTVADATFVLNRAVDTAATGNAITYRANDQDLRETSNANNVASWDDFPHPADGVVADGVIDSDFLFYARNDSPGNAQGFWGAVSEDQPPWYTRRRTEPANSEVDDETMPIRIDFDGTTFTARLGEYQPRFSGDSFTNPGPSFFLNPLSNLVFFQNRLIFTSGERVISSRANDLTNFWRNSEKVQTAADPIDVGISENQINNIDHIIEYNDTLICFTRANRQVALQADEGIWSPTTVFWRTLGQYDVAPYIQPVRLDNGVYFVSERNFANQIWRYQFDPNQGDMFNDMTAHAEGLVPATARQLEGSERHGKLFVLTRAEPNKIYINDRGAWVRWTFDPEDEILTIRSLDEILYMVVRRGETLWLERVYISSPPDDVFEHMDGLKSLGYAVRLDRRQVLQGVYDVDENTTTWTLPYNDERVDTLVLGPNWDSDFDDQEQRLAGVIFEPEIGEDGSGNTTLTVDGQYATNIANEDATVIVGRNYVKRVRLSRQYVRSNEGAAMYGNTTLLGGRVRLRETGYLRVEVTPKNRFTRGFEYLFPHVKSTPFDGVLVSPRAEFYFRISARADDTIIEMINDKPVPSGLIDAELTAKFVPGTKSATT